MADLLTTNVKLLNMETGSHDGTWGQDFDTGVLEVLDDLFGTLAGIATSGDAVTPIALSDIQMQQAGFVVTGTLTANATIQVPDGRARLFVIDNSLVVGAFALKVQHTTGTPQTIPAGKSLISCDGSTVRIIASAVLPGSPLSAAEVTIASASNLNLGTALSNQALITGTTTVTDFGTGQAGMLRLIRFNNVLTLTHNATNLILPTAANIVTANGDRCLAVCTGSNNWIVYFYTRGTGQAFALFGAQASVAVGGTVDLNVPSNNVSITGTSGTVTTFGSTAPVGKLVEVIVSTSGSTILTHSSNLQLPTLANIVASSGDRFTALCLSSGVWVVLAFNRADGDSVLGPANEGAFAIIASNTTTDLSTVRTKNVIITGTTTITGLGTCPSGTAKTLYFNAALLLTNSATLVLPGGANLTTAAGDTCIAVTGSSPGTWIIMAYQRQSGKAVTPGPFTSSYDSGQKPVTVNSTFTVSHGLGTIPLLATVTIECLTSNNNFTAGDVLLYDNIGNPPSGSDTGLVITVTSTQLIVRIGNVGIGPLLNPSTGIRFNPTDTNFAMRVRLWA
jgi:sarcosine oxidase gamma subunit